MENISEPSNPITYVISEIVEPALIPEYEAWTKGINDAASHFEGFVGVDVIRPRDHAYPEYVVIVKFNDYTCFRRWITSSTYQEWINKSRGLIAAKSHQQLPSGIEMWFTLPKNTPLKSSQPSYYKKVVLGVLAVYPLILLANLILNPFLTGVPALLALLISVTLVSALLTYPVMPWLTSLLGFWLYPSMFKQRRRSKR